MSVNSVLYNNESLMELIKGFILKTHSGTNTHAHTRSATHTCTGVFNYS